MPLTEAQAKSLLTKAKQRKPDLSRDEAKAILAEGNKRVGASQAKPEDTRTGLQKAADFLGLGTTLRNISSLGLVGQGERTREAGEQSAQAFKQAQSLTEQAKALPQGSAEQKALLNRARAIMSGSEKTQQEFQQDLGRRQQMAGVTEKELGMDQGEFLTRRGLGQSGELASWLLPGATTGMGSQILRTGQIGKPILSGATTGGRRVLQAAGKGAISGFGQGAAGASREADTALEALFQIGTGTAAGAGTGALIQTGAEGLRKAQEAAARGAEKLKKKGLEAMSKTYKENRTAQKIIDKAGGPEKLSQEFIDNKVPKTKTGVQKDLRKMAKQYESKVTDRIKNTNKYGNVDEMIDDLLKDAKKIYDIPDPKTQRELKAFTEYLESFRGKYTGGKARIDSLNHLRKSLDRTYQGVNPNNVVDGEKLANDMLADKLRGWVQNEAPLTKSFFKRYSLLKKAEQIYYKEPKTGIVELTAAAVSPGTGMMNILELLAGKAIRSPGVTRTAGTALAGPTPKVPLQIPAGETVRQAGLNTKSVEKIVNPAVAALQRMINKEKEFKRSDKKLR